MDTPDPVLEWVERVSMYLARDGVPPIAGRVLGWLMVCDPPEQSAAQISDATGASRASLTSNLRLLTAMGFLSPGPGRATGPPTTAWPTTRGPWWSAARSSP
ncbi:GbsR/MarR family transcriptional regulator [Promicromonospora soli]